MLAQIMTIDTGRKELEVEPSVLLPADPPRQPPVQAPVQASQPLAQISTPASQPTPQAQPTPASQPSSQPMGSQPLVAPSDTSPKSEAGKENEFTGGGFKKNDKFDDSFLNNKKEDFGFDPHQGKKEDFGNKDGFGEQEQRWGNQDGFNRQKTFRSPNNQKPTRRAGTGRNHNNFRPKCHNCGDEHYTDQCKVRILIKKSDFWLRM